MQVIQAEKQPLTSMPALSNIANAPGMIRLGCTLESPAADYLLSVDPTVQIILPRKSAHYPVFDPRNPRHNPSLAQGDYYPAGPSNPSRSVRWMQSLHKKSIRNSGLLSFRPGFRRRPIPASHSDDIPSLWSSTDSKGSSDQQGTLYSSTVSEASTEEDVEFGTDLQRISCNYPPEADGNMDRYLRSLPGQLVWEDGTVSSESTVVPHRETGESLNLRFSNAQSSKPSNNKDIGTESPNVASTDGTGGDNSQPMDPTSPSRNPSESYFSQAAGSETGGLCITAPVPSNSGTPEPQLPSGTVDSDRDGAASASRPSNLSVPIIETGSSRPVGTSANMTSYVSNSQITDAELAIESLELCQKLELGENHDRERDVTHEACEIAGHSASHSPGAVDSTNSHSPATPSTGFLELSNHGGDIPRITIDMRVTSGQVQEGAGNRTVRCNDSTENIPLIPARAEDRLSEHSADASVLRSQSSQDDLASLLALRDEYFLVDKSNDLRPDRGNNATKAERSFSGDGCLYSGPGLDRNSSTRVRDIPEIIGPRTPVQVRGTRPFRREYNTSDSDEYLMTYPAIDRHYFS
ncbi:uncharacterized protein BO96DRAFT_383618 [Aspergillus niger CBS 101883]|uniref:uncharacterized protein n=1 Tax=Aspergillus lacticoffeatus (strain CBS 101883) TaxID=1450533 RepID=UPI000D7F5972|nr:uncharacterized protein BO96DRAFT_383618 [Aspergillus niger CBS 101883]PYH61426.1 hypothetical protein BO96DRAFT_383618 [Aspergillus niger CBS 101883]